MKVPGRALSFASKHLDANRQFICDMATQSVQALHLIAEQHQLDREALLELATLSGRAIAVAAEHFSASRSQVVESTEQDRYRVHFMSEQLRLDHQVVLEAVKQSSRALELVSERVRQSHDLICSLSEQSASALELDTQQLSVDFQAVVEAVKQDVRYYRTGGAAEKFRADREVLMESMRQNCLTFEQVGVKHRADRGLVLESLNRDVHALNLAAEQVRASHEFIHDSVKRNGLALQFVAEHLRGEQEDAFTRRSTPSSKSASSHHIASTRRPSPSPGRAPQQPPSRAPSLHDGDLRRTGAPRQEGMPSKGPLAQALPQQNDFGLPPPRHVPGQGGFNPQVRVMSMTPAIGPLGAHRMVP
eukprot:gnl/TRDRNA2_/TRDRNA2_169538_c0_seq1.p1 gnl/TRDRNA2_/TRDRNA2_169538_c0~~gnl/TRDRNA2_/TRDRNA2_169538_c0_seq1.p1  ORF type:complete len:380 (+),score=62.09 gnl/TRDRNA2_/TRDRNA2_169538_c0_seq1:62-1141(+)